MLWIYFLLNHLLGVCVCVGVCGCVCVGVCVLGSCRSTFPSLNGALGTAKHAAYSVRKQGQQLSGVILCNQVN